MTAKWLLGGGIAVGLVLALAHDVLAAPFTAASTSARATSVANGAQADLQGDASDIGAGLLFSSFAQAGGATSSADAAADVGLLRAQAFTVYPIESLGDGSADATAFWSDLFTIDIPGHPGEAGLLFASVVIDGFADASGSAQARFNFSAKRDASIIAAITETFRPGGALGSGVPGVVEMAISFTEGTPFLFQMGVSVEVGRCSIFCSGAESLEPGTVDINFGHTVVWNGVSGIQLGALTIPTGGFAVTGASGVDYTASFATPSPSQVPEVPEPGTVTLLLTGLGLIGARCRRSSSRR